MSESPLKAPPEAPEPEEDAGTLLRPLPYRPSRLERFAVSFLRKRAAQRSPEPSQDDPIHVLTPAERKEINRIVRSTVLRAIFAGLWATSLNATLELLLRRANVPTLEYYLAMIFLAILCTIFEIFYLYRSHLFAVLELSRAAGADLNAEEASFDGAVALCEAMGRCALELPDPVRVVEGIDPRRESSRLALLLAVLLYKFKRGLTSFFTKALIRRAAPREFLRAYVPFVAMPIAGLWNALVSYRILREARVRVIGPSAVMEIRELLFRDAPPLSSLGRVMLLRAVGVAMVRKRAAHPNLLALLRALTSQLGGARGTELDSTRRFLRDLPRLEGLERRLVLTVLQIGAILDGSLSRRERKLLIEARALCGLSPELHAAEALLKHFSHGDPLSKELLDELAR